MEPVDPAPAFRRLEEVMRKLVRVPKAAVDEEIAAGRRAGKLARQRHARRHLRKKPA